MIPVWSICDLLIGFGQDALFSWGTGYIEAGGGLGDLPSLPGWSSRKGHTMRRGRGFGVSSPGRGLEACNMDAFEERQGGMWLACHGKPGGQMGEAGAGWGPKRVGGVASRRKWHLRAVFGQVEGGPSSSKGQVTQPFKAGASTCY